MEASVATRIVGVAVHVLPCVSLCVDALLVAAFWQQGLVAWAVAIIVVFAMSCAASFVRVALDEDAGRSKAWMRCAAVSFGLIHVPPITTATIGSSDRQVAMRRVAEHTALSSARNVMSGVCASAALVASQAGVPILLLCISLALSLFCTASAATSMLYTRGVDAGGGGHAILITVAVGTTQAGSVCAMGAPLGLFARDGAAGWLGLAMLLLLSSAEMELAAGAPAGVHSCMLLLLSSALALCVGAWWASMQLAVAVATVPTVSLCLWRAAGREVHPLRRVGWMLVLWPLSIAAAVSDAHLLICPRGGSAARHARRPWVAHVVARRLVIASLGASALAAVYLGRLTHVDGAGLAAVLSILLVADIAAAAWLLLRRRRRHAHDPHTSAAPSLGALHDHGGRLTADLLGRDSLVSTGPPVGSMPFPMPLPPGTMSAGGVPPPDAGQLNTGGPPTWPPPWPATPEATGTCRERITDVTVLLGGVVADTKEGRGGGTDVNAVSLGEDEDHHTPSKRSGGGGCCCTGRARRGRRICCRSVCGVLTVSAFVTCLASAACVADPFAAQWAARHANVSGVNLGGWMIAERWMVGGDEVSTACCGRIPGPYLGVSYELAPSERQMSVELRARDEVGRLLAFRDSYISRADVANIAALGLSAVRVPFGAWEASDSLCPNDVGYITGRGLGYLDDAITWADEFDLKVLLDLHGACGGESGEQSTGDMDANWTASKFNASANLAVLHIVASRYAKRQNVIAIELLNEPTLPNDEALAFYRAASDVVRKAGMPPERVAIVINMFMMQEALTRAWASLNWGLPARDFPNIVYDWHIYVAFDIVATVPLYLFGHVPLLIGIVVEAFASVLTLSGRPSLVGEFSLALPAQGSAEGSLSAMTPAQREDVMRTFARAQLRSFRRGQRSAGVYYWSWNGPAAPEDPYTEYAAWGMQYAVRRGWLRDWLDNGTAVM